MKKIALIAISAALLSACADDPEKLAVCKGPLFALNTGHWQAKPADLQKPKAGMNE